MDKPRLKAAILIISDTASQDPSTDKAGDILSDSIAIHGNDQWDFTKREVVPDDILAIQRSVIQYCDGEDFVNALITTGGTGFAIKDRTPEAINPLIHKHAPGLV
jgi:gephyrin